MSFLSLEGLKYTINKLYTKISGVCDALDERVTANEESLENKADIDHDHTVSDIIDLPEDMLKQYYIENYDGSEEILNSLLTLSGGYSFSFTSTDSTTTIYCCNDGTAYIAGDGEILDDINYISAYSSDIVTITTLVILEGVTYVGKNVIEGYTNITTIYIPSSVTSIHSHAFFDTSQKLKIIVNKPEGSIEITSSSGAWGNPDATVVWTGAVMNTDDKVSKSGDTMTGDLSMSNNSILNANIVNVTEIETATITNLESSILRINSVGGNLEISSAMATSISSWNGDLTLISNGGEINLRGDCKFDEIDTFFTQLPQDITNEEKEWLDDYLPNLFLDLRRNKSDSSALVGDEDYVLTGTGDSSEFRAPIIKNLEGETVSTSSTTTATAGTMAIIVNDLADRTYSSTTVATGNVASGQYSFVEGQCNTASSSCCHVEGYRNTASNTNCHAEGQATTASGSVSHSEGYSTTASGAYSHAEGRATTASGQNSHAEGYGTTASGIYSHAEGYNTIASGDYSHAEGYSTTANTHQMVIGRCNVLSDGPTSITETTGDLFIIGNGTGTGATSNAFRVSTAGVCYAGSSVESTGADFAEYFEWEDGNPENEDRRGLFVTLEDEKIRIANSDDEYILGVVSATPTITGDSQSEVWGGMYMRDIFGEIVTETVTVEEYTDEEVGEVIPEHEVIRYVLNPEYDNEQTYVSRDQRPEWAPVGLIGKLIVVDDGSCEVNGYCKVADGGIATKADTGYRVMSRLDDTHIRILLK